jgi:hypothetical protein
MPKLLQYKLVKLQIESFRELGFNTEFEIMGYHDQFAAKIKIIKDKQEYFVSHKNWDIVSLQLCGLYLELKN